MMTSLIIDCTLKGFVLLAIAVIIAAALYKTSSATWHLAWPGLARPPALDGAEMVTGV